MENKLEQQVFSEAQVSTMLGLTKKQLDHLRWQRGFPCVSLTRRVRVYLVDDVLEYIERLSRQGLYDRLARKGGKPSVKGKKAGPASQVS